jgi:hypothetical protein
MLNKTIWLLWIQGWEDVPWLIREVAKSWEINNPGWNIEYVTLGNLHKYVCDIDYIYDEKKEIIPQHKADIIRLSLLKNHGGVWADATMLCMQPLDSWVPEAVKPSGLWMYHGHGGGMGAMQGPAIWFIVSEKDSLMISAWKSACDDYWRDRVRTDSYFWLDALFKELHKSDSKFRSKWNLAPHLYSELRGQAHSLAFQNGMASSNQNLKFIFRERPPYVLKFWWKEWEKKFSDVNSLECRNSNGYYAIQMSKRKFTYKHKMTSKKSIALQIKMLIFNIKYFILYEFKMILSVHIKKIIGGI